MSPVHWIWIKWGRRLSENGHVWIGLDISPSMLDFALEREAEGEVLLGDMGQALGLRPGVIDGAISISVFRAFFGLSYRCLARGEKNSFFKFTQKV
ncbi:18S rRNA (guanine-N(7))-methyltransferase RID2-like isoform X3 [Syzygium oleosum]|uniref:18S rRNA (guanine-N(7))-methyltransferase RID2-like isoform X3 n=1 Tax=Syzygium oleosum TaxID=219896 RepID=UPI0024BA9343|nr:18S rRNA (guanine-N(7))-methyltransferase RID2-like isoform X3 [Syzygium oleosum]